MEYYQVLEGDYHDHGNVSDIMEYQGRFKRAVALHMAKKRERRQRRAANCKKAMMIDQLRKKAEDFGIKLESRSDLKYIMMPPPPYEPRETPAPMTEGLLTVDKMEAARKAEEDWEEGQMQSVLEGTKN